MYDHIRKEMKGYASIYVATGINLQHLSSIYDFQHTKFSNGYDLTIGNDVRTVCHHDSFYSTEVLSQLNSRKITTNSETSPS